MFAATTHPRSHASFYLSAGLHCVLFYLVLAAGPRFIQPSSVAFGNGGLGASDHIVYLGEASMLRETELHVPAPKTKHQRNTKPSTPKSRQDDPINAPVESARSGSAFGSASVGPKTGYESRPALPVIFPNPVVERADIPSGVAGDVIVEVTIDEKGNVADTKVLESLGYGLEDKVLEALKNWRFTPAIMNGVAIASRQDVHFHFPS